MLSTADVADILKDLILSRLFFLNEQVPIIYILVCHLTTSIKMRCSGLVLFLATLAAAAPSLFGITARSPRDG